MRARATAALLALGAVALAAAPALAQEPLKIGFITTLSGPAGYLGQDVRDGFMLAVERAGGSLGGTPVEVIVEDDALKPANGRQIADRFMNDEGIKLLTGLVFSNVAGAVVPEVVDSGNIFVSPNAGPSEFAGAGCHENYFVISWLTDTMQGSAGANASDLGYTRAYLVAPNYQAGKDAMEGFRRYFEGEVVGETFTQLDQTDFSAELAMIRAAAPEVVFMFEPGALGIAFTKQYHQAGLGAEIPLVVSEAAMDHTILKAVGPASVGINVSGAWNTDLDNEANRTFVEAFREAYGRTPTMYAAQGYDTAMAIGAALAGTGGSVDDTAAFREAMLKANFDSVRGDFRFNTNQHPIQDWYAMTVIEGEDGVPTLKTRTKLLDDHGDPFAADCGL